jgi:hypothetical protein
MTPTARPKENILTSTADPIFKIASNQPTIFFASWLIPF